MTDRLAILHIGVTKTGTSSIQSWLAANRAPLAAAGIHLPETLGRQNHERLARIADGTAPPVMAERFAAEMAALPDTVRTLVFTSEAFGSQLTRPERVAPLKALLDRHVGACRVVVYLRRQDEHAVSSFSTAMRAGEPRRTAPLSGRPKDYEALLEAWSAAFGRAAIRPRIFGPGELVGDDVVADFLATAGIALPPDAMPPALGRNPSLRPEAQRFLAHLAEHARASGVVEDDFRALPNRSRLIAALDARFAGRGSLPARAEAVAFLDRCREANERVRAAWFPERATLFAEDFSRYPEVADAPPTLEAMFEVALGTVLALLTEDAPKPDRGARQAEREARRAARAERLAGRGRRGGGG
ncbi:MAG: hypothetical protein K2X49_25830 [Acetobacteraceae bacterium]|nr:hypothetical protein [Acetobacteraceae bacterium]